MQGTKRILGIDILKALAICAVVVDHAFFLYRQPIKDNYFWQGMYFSVPFFFFISGYTNYLSFNKPSLLTGSGKVLSFYAKRFKILLPYFIFSPLFYLVFTNPAKLSLENYIFKTVTFSLFPVFYFLAALIQLYLFSPLIFVLIRRNIGLIVTSVLFITVLIAGYYSDKIFRNNLIYINYGKILGGLYFPVYILGAWVAKQKLKVSRKVFLGAIIVLIVLEALFVTGLLKGARLGINYPLILWSMCLLVVLVGLMRKIKRGQGVNILTKLGKMSLYVYIFHYPILLFFSRRVPLENYFAFFAVVIMTVSLSYLAGIMYLKIAQIIYNRFLFVLRAVFLKR